MRLHDHLEWDEDKAAKNQKKHHVTFDDAARVLADEEDRYITTASHPDDRKIVMRISWTDRSSHEKQITRIISARLASLRERKSYAQEIRRG
jgi:uncharacterized protein